MVSLYSRSSTTVSPNNHVICLSQASVNLAIWSSPVHRLWAQKNPGGHDCLWIIFLCLTITNISQGGPPLPHIWQTHGLSQPCFNMTEINSYVSPETPATLGYAIYDNQICNYLGTLSSRLNQTHVMVIQIEFNNESWTGVICVLWVICLYVKDSGPWNVCHWEGGWFLAHALPAVIVGTDTGLFSVCYKRYWALGFVFLSSNRTHCTLGSLYHLWVLGARKLMLRIDTLAGCCAVHNKLSLSDLCLL